MRKLTMKMSMSIGMSKLSWLGLWLWFLFPAGLYAGDIILLVHNTDPAHDHARGDTHRRIETGRRLRSLVGNIGRPDTLGFTVREAAVSELHQLDEVLAKLILPTDRIVGLALSGHGSEQYYCLSAAGLYQGREAAEILYPILSRYHLAPHFAVITLACLTGRKVKNESSFTSELGSHFWRQNETHHGKIRQLESVGYTNWSNPYLLDEPLPWDYYLMKLKIPQSAGAVAIAFNSAVNRVINAGGVLTTAVLGFLYIAAIEFASVYLPHSPLDPGTSRLLKLFVEIPPLYSLLFTLPKDVRVYSFGAENRPEHSLFARDFLKRFLNAAAVETKNCGLALGAESVE